TACTSSSPRAQRAGPAIGRSPRATPATARRPSTRARWPRWRRSPLRRPSPGRAAGWCGRRRRCDGAARAVEGGRGTILSLPPKRDRPAGMGFCESEVSVARNPGLLSWAAVLAALAAGACEPKRSLVLLDVTGDHDYGTVTLTIAADDKASKVFAGVHLTVAPAFQAALYLPGDVAGN